MTCQPIRVLHIVYSLEKGGLESRLMDLYRVINRNRIQFDFYVESGLPGHFDNEVKLLGGKVFYQEKRRVFGIPRFDLFFSFLENHPEYKIIYSYNQWCGFYLRQAWKRDVRYRIAFARTALVGNSVKCLMKNLVKMNAKKYATHQFAVSREAGIWLFGKKSVKNGDTLVLPNAIDVEKFAFSADVRSKKRYELGLQGKLVFLHVGNIRPEKNHIFLLEVFSEIKKKISNSELVLVGGGSFELLADKIDFLGIGDCVRYLGVRDDVSQLLQACDVFLFPSIYEGFPGAVLEAESAGLPCFISDSITAEVVLTSYVWQLPVIGKSKDWASAIIEFVKSPDFRKINRTKIWLEIVDAGYDIKRLKEYTESFLERLDKCI